MILDAPPSTISTSPPANLQAPGSPSTEEFQEFKKQLAEHWRADRSDALNLTLLCLKALCMLAPLIVVAIIAAWGSWHVVRLVYFYWVAPASKVSSAATTLGTPKMQVTITATETTTATVTEIWSKVAVVSGA